MAISMEQLQHLEASFEAKINKLASELTQARADLAPNVAAHAAGAPISVYDELTPTRADLAQSVTVIAACKRK